jgi:hypothetical protein
MTWEPPGFEEIKMDAEFTAYCEDLDDAPQKPVKTIAPDAAACESAS